MFSGSSRQYPHLIAYLDEFVRSREAEAKPIPRWALLAGLCLVLGMATESYASAAAMGAGVLVSLFIANRMRANRARPSLATLRRQEAREVAETMRKCIELRRLHRDLDSGSLTLLEESARHWARVNAAFTSTFWSDPNLAPTYANARNAATAAANEAMQDILLLFRPALPSTATNRQPMDYVEEAIETYVFKGPPAAAPPPPGFRPAREIADKLRDLAAEVERIAASARSADSMEGAPVSNLDASLGELRAIREAEDELRQNLRG